MVNRVPEFVLVSRNHQRRLRPADHAQRIGCPAVGEQDIERAMIGQTIDPDEILCVGLVAQVAKGKAFGGAHPEHMVHNGRPLMPRKHNHIEGLSAFLDR